jgi:transposase
VKPKEDAMPAAKYIVELTADEREELLAIIRRGKTLARKITRARILLKADQRLTDEQIASDLEIGSATVGRVRQRFVEGGLENALSERPRASKRRKLSAKQEAHLIAVACSKAPEGRARWTLRLLADRVVELGFTESCSHETVRRLLKKRSSSPGRKQSGAYPK